MSLSIQADLLAAITRRARRLYGGNISAVIAEMGEDVKRLDAMDRCLEKYRVGPLTDERRARIDAELLELVNVEPLTERLARVAGIALAAVRGATSIDAVVMASAASRGDVVLTSDPVDLKRLRGYFPGVRVLVV